MDDSLERIAQALEDLVVMQAEIAMVNASTQWKQLEVQLATLRVEKPAVFDILRTAWADGWLVRPDWAPDADTPAA